jgi:cell division protein FtsB
MLRSSDFTISLTAGRIKQYMDDLTHEQLAVLMGVIAAFLAAIAPISTVWITRQAAKRSELESLKTRIDALEAKNEQLTRERIILWEYVGELRRILREHQIEAPPLPKLEL